MNTIVRRVLLSLAAGAAATCLLIGASSAADSVGFPAIAKALFWQNTLLQGCVPLLNIGTAARPVHEGSPLNILAFLASIPLGLIIYSAVAYSLIAKVRRRGNRPGRARENPPRQQ